MLYYTDLHIHSKYSRATSKNCNLEELALWAKKKGLSLISTGDFTHPAWFNEIKEKLIPYDDGTFRLRPDIEKEIFKGQTPVKFILSVEISTIYKKGDKTRKVHHIVFVPNLKSAEKIRNKLETIGNIKSDGRPILGLDSRNLLETVLESGEDSYIIPAHIWTPWFSVLGSKSGFDSIEECYEDLSDYIFAVETGLSSDPEMNWHVSKLDRFRLVSNSDAHSPSKLAREATVFDHNPNYYSIMNALKTGEGYIGTVEFFPEEGKYHEDGHRKCNVCMTPEETKKVNGICPVCGKPMTIGVSYRVNELSDRKTIITPPKTAGQVFSLVPLQEVLSEIMGVGSSSKKVVNKYERLINKFGSELAILQEIPTDEISKDNTLLGEGISRLRKGQVIKHAGFDGEYGNIRLFEENELTNQNITEQIEITNKLKKEMKEAINLIYGKQNSEEIFNNVITHANNAINARSDKLKLQDKTRKSEWYKDEIIYMFYVDQFGVVKQNSANTFKDTRAMFDYLQNLGVTTLYMLPFADSPMKDAGFDVKNPRKVRNELGGMTEFKTFVTDAKKRGFKIKADLVLNHLSDEHEWFKKLEAGDIKYLDYFIYKEKMPEYNKYVDEKLGTVIEYKEEDGKISKRRLIFPENTENNYSKREELLSLSYILSIPTRHKLGKSGSFILYA